jgi:hypothetical protein
MPFLLLILLSLSSFAASNLTELSKTKKWHKLLHYKKDLLGRTASEADGQGFFLHPEGRRNPEAELKRSVEIFAETKTPTDDHPICKFPLRYKWLNKELGMPWSASFEGCRKYLGFFSKLAARRASLVFSSYYLTNPNSAFGHTLLRFSRFDDRNETEMLDYGINYAAKANESNPFLYAVKGLFGGFVGEYTAVPYYYKIREYSNFEFRDLWSYDLKVTMPEVLEMVDHIWELGQTHFDYFYFRENCSYHILSILEVARPELELTDRYVLYTIPADTVRLLKEEGLIETGKRRESTYSRLLRLSSNLPAKDLALAKMIAAEPKETSSLLQGLPPERAAGVLDVSLEAFDYNHFEKILKEDLATKELKKHVLLARAQNPLISRDSFISTADEKDSPALSHSPTRLTLAHNYRHEMGQGTRFEYRAALHDLLDPRPGSLKEAQLEIARLSFELREENYRDSRLSFDQLSIFNLKNYPEQNFWASPVAWEVDVGAKQLYRRTCWDCPAAFVNGSIGNSLQTFKGKLLVAVFLNGEVDLQSQFENNYRTGLGPKSYFRVLFTEAWMLGLSSVYHFNTYEHRKLFQDHEWLNDLELRHHVSDRVTLSLRGSGVERDRRWIGTGEFGVQYFYE